MQFRCIVIVDHGHTLLKTFKMFEVSPQVTCIYIYIYNYIHNIHIQHASIIIGSHDFTRIKNTADDLPTIDYRHLERVHMLQTNAADYLTVKPLKLLLRVAHTRTDSLHDPKQQTNTVLYIYIYFLRMEMTLPNDHWTHL